MDHEQDEAVEQIDAQVIDQHGDELVEIIDELLIEEISIDGMCGVY